MKKENDNKIEEQNVKRKKIKNLFFIYSLHILPIFQDKQ